MEKENKRYYTSKAGETSSVWVKEAGKTCGTMGRKDRLTGFRVLIKSSRDRHLRFIDLKVL